MQHQHLMGTLSMGLICALLTCQAAAETDSAAIRDVTRALQIKAGGFRKDLKTGELVQAVTVTNISRQTIAGDLYLVMNDLDTAISVTSKSKKTTLGDGTAKAFALNALYGKTQGLKPGQQLTTVLRFAAASKRQIRYQPRIFQQDINSN